MLSKYSSLQMYLKSFHSNLKIKNNDKVLREKKTLYTKEQTYCLKPINLENN